MVKFDMLKPNGWETETLTEDIEFSVNNIINNIKIGYCDSAILYDGYRIANNYFYNVQTIIVC